MANPIFEKLKQLDLSKLEETKREQVKVNIQQALDLESDANISEEELKAVEAFYDKLKSNIDAIVAPAQPELPAQPGADADAKDEKLKKQSKTKPQTKAKYTKEQKIAIVDKDIKLPHKQVADSLGITDESLWLKQNGCSSEMNTIYTFLGGRYAQFKEKDKSTDKLQAAIIKASQKIADKLEQLTQDEIEAIKANTGVKKANVEEEEEEHNAGEGEQEQHDAGDAEADENIEQEPNAEADGNIEQEPDAETDNGGTDDESEEQKGGIFKNPLLKTFLGV